MFCVGRPYQLVMRGLLTELTGVVKFVTLFDKHMIKLTE